MKLARRHFMELGASAVVFAVLSTPARTESYPTRPVRIIVGFPAGGLGDIAARLVGQSLSEQLGQQFIVENRPGAGTNIATEAVVRAPADGYTLLLTTALNAINATVYNRLNFDFVRDIAPVGSIVDAAFVLEVNPSVPAKTVPEFIAYAKANPGKLLMASGGVGSPEHVAGELFKMMTGVDMLHVPYRGSAPAVIDLVGGHAHLCFGPIAPSIEHIRAGSLRALAVTTARRADALPNIPALGDFLPGFEASASLGLGAPTNTPTEVIDILNKAINVALADENLEARFADLGMTVLPGSPGDFGNLIATDTEKWAKVVKFAGIHVD